jgi:hypothetical protein
MKYSLRSLMLVGVLGPPLLAIAIVYTPTVMRKLSAPRMPRRTIAFPATPAAPAKVAIPPGWNLDLATIIPRHQNCGKRWKWTDLRVSALTHEILNSRPTAGDGDRGLGGRVVGG